MNEVPDQMKRDNWALFIHARSHDPSVKIPYTRELVSSLINTMSLIDEHKYDELLAFCDGEAQTAIRMYKENWQEAIIVCGKILNLIGHLLYIREYAIPQGDCFKELFKAEAKK